MTTSNTGLHASGGFLIVTAVAGLPNGRGHAWQDRWSVGQAPHGGWLIVADGITGGTRGETAAQTAVAVADRVLRGSDLLEGVVLTAVETAHAAVQPWYANAHGGTTLTILTLTPHRLVVAQVGDSPAHLVTAEGLHRLTPATTPGPLTSWVGQPAPLTPWLDSWPVHGDTCALVTTDGVRPQGFHVPPGTAPEELVHRLLREGRTPNLDDATAAAIHLTALP